MEELLDGENVFGLHRTDHASAKRTHRKSDDCEGRRPGAKSNAQLNATIPTRWGS